MNQINTKNKLTKRSMQCSGCVHLSFVIRTRHTQGARDRGPLEKREGRAACGFLLLRDRGPLEKREGRAARGFLTRGVISRAWRRRSSCSCLAMADAERAASLDPPPPARAAAELAIDTRSLAGTAAADDGTPLMVEQYGQRT